LLGGGLQGEVAKWVDGLKRHYHLVWR